jgi:hypothetical protein
MEETSPLPRNLQALAAACLLALAIPVAGTSASEVKELKWSELLPPPDPAAAKEKKSKTFFSGAINPKGADGTTPAAELPEGEWMSLKRKQPGGSRLARTVAALDGRNVRIGGYVVPLDFNQTSVTEFLLVPFVGACIHVPPPPANQIIYVRSPKGFAIAGTFDPVWVTGVIRTAAQSTGLADTGYTIEAEIVEARAP